MSSGELHPEWLSTELYNILEDYDCEEITVSELEEKLITLVRDIRKYKKDLESGFEDEDDDDEIPELSFDD